MKKALAVGAFLAISISMHSCRPKDQNTNVTPHNLSSLTDVYDQLGLKPKTLTIDAAMGGSFYGNSGTRYIFTANSFQTANGVTVSGNIHIAVCEYLKKGDMLFSKMLPISDGRPLVSGGQLTISASQNDQPVYLKPGYTFTAKIPTIGTPDQNMQLFKGQPTSDTVFSKFNWTLGDNIKTIGIFTSVGEDTFRVVADSLKPMNADRFLSFNTRGCYLKVTLPNGTIPANTNVNVYSILKQEKAIILMSFGNYRTNYGLVVSDQPMYFVAFTLIDGKFYAGLTDATPVNGGTYHMTISERDPVQFMAQLNNL